MIEVSVRPARSEEAAEVARIQVTTWQTAYTSILPAAVLAQLSPARAEPAWTAAIDHPPTSRHHVLVAVEGQWLAGFVALGPADDVEEGAPERQTTVAIGPLLVEPRWSRRGHGSRLLAAAIDIAREDGMTRAITWVPELDDVSRTFLASAGWAADGLARTLDTGAGEVREVRLHTSLIEESA